MIRHWIRQLNDWYNVRKRWAQIVILLGFCLAFLLTLWLAVIYIRFDATQFNTKTPGSIGQASGPATIDPGLKNKK